MNYLEEAFNTKSPFYQKMIKIIKQEQKGDLFNHHLIPKCFYKLKGLKIDDSKENLFPLTLYNHILIHYYAYLCSKDCIKEQLLNAIGCMLQTYNRHVLTEEKEVEKIALAISKRFDLKKERKKIFLEKIKEKGLDNFYDYSKINYINNKEKIEVYCKKHNCFFFVSPKLHLYRGDGCPKCKSEKSSLAQRKTTECFIEQAKKIHGDYYDYSKVKYINDITKIEIFCKHCNKSFLQIAGKHLQGHGCPNCRYERMSKTRKENSNERSK